MKSLPRPSLLVNVGERAAVEPRQPAPAGSDPQVAGGVLTERTHHVVGQAVLGREAADLTVAQAVEALAVGADPDGAERVLEYGEYRVAREALGAAERGDVAVTQAVETTAVGADPQASLAVLVQRHDRVAGTALRGW